MTHDFKVHVMKHNVLKYWDNEPNGKSIVIRLERIYCLTQLSGGYIYILFIT